MIKSPQHKLEKCLNKLLQPVLRFYSRYIVNDSFEVVDRIRNLNSKDTFMPSCDVKKLFTNLPLEEIIQTSTEKLYSLEKPKIKRDNFVKLMTIATSEVQFRFNNTLYCQPDCVAMGSPLGPTVANFFMGYLDYSLVPSLSSQIIYIRYMKITNMRRHILTLSIQFSSCNI